MRPEIALLSTGGLASPSKGSSATVGVQRSKLGRMLVDGRGHTLYLFEKDKHARAAATAPAQPPGGR